MSALVAPRWVLAVSVIPEAITRPIVLPPEIPVGTPGGIGHAGVRLYQKKTCNIAKEPDQLLRAEQTANALPGIGRRQKRPYGRGTCNMARPELNPTNIFLRKKQANI